MQFNSSSLKPSHSANRIPHPKMNSAKRTESNNDKIPKKKAKVDPDSAKIEPPNKKLSQDPYEHLSADVHALINQHFNAKDVKQASLVSTQWYVQLGESKIAMEKLLVAPNRSTRKLSKDEFGEVFLQSRRRYSSLDFKCTFERHADVMEKLLVKLAPSLANVKVGHVHKSFKVPTASFPLLRTLEFTVDSHPLFHKFFKCFANDKLEKLVLMSVTKGTADLLKSVKQLKELVIERDAEALMWQNISGLCRFSLTKLIIGYVEGSEAKANVIKLLESQRSSLKSFGMIHDMDLFKFVMTMPEIKCIGFAMTSPDGLNGLTPNQGIEKLGVPWIRLLPQYFRPLLRLLPNLKQLQIHEIDRETLEAIATSSISVRKVYYKYCDSDLNGSTSQMYEELKLATTGVFNNNIQLINRSSAFDIYA